jgi:spermidine/putrescine transport system ATP-binding protein
MGEPLDLKVSGLSKNFGAVQVLQDLSLEIPDGQFVTLLGPSGCGKSTLLRILAGFEVADRGTATLGGKDLLALPPHQRPVNTVFQNYALFPHLSVRENVAFGLRSKKLPEAEIQRRAGAVMEMVRISELGERHPGELSGGQRQRVALARALAVEPDVLLLDEPMSALDAHLRHDLQMELRALQRKTDTTFILVTHDQDEAIAVSDRILVMDGGRIVQDGSAEEVWDRPVSKFVASFLGRANLLSVRRASANTVESPVGPLVVPRDPPWSEGTLAIRPEDIEVREDQPAVNGIRGTVGIRLFRGDHWELSVDCGPVALRVLTETDTHHEAGQEVWLELPPDDIQVLQD